MAVATPTAPSANRSVGWFAHLVGAKSRLQVNEAVWGYIFLIPWVIGLVAFILGPILASAYFSFTEYDVINAPRWLGMENYTQALMNDKQFWPSLWRTLVYSIVVVPVGLVCSLGLAMLLNQKVKGTNLFRTFFFLPSLTPAVALALLWTWLFHPTVGQINAALGFFGIPGPGWLSSKDWAMSALIIISLWASIGGNHMLIFLAGLQGVPQELYEAAEIDGAGSWARFRAVTVPMISPTLLFNLILGVIGALKVFTLAFVATKGGPSYATWFLALHIYRQAFEYFRMGYASALAWILFFYILALTLILFRLSDLWVYYEADERKE